MCFSKNILVDQNNKNASNTSDIGQISISCQLLIAIFITDIDKTLDKNSIHQQLCQKSSHLLLDHSLQLKPKKEDQILPH